MLLFFSDSYNGFKVILAKFEDIPILNNTFVDSIHSIIESNVKLGLIKPQTFTVFPYSEVESAFR